MYTEITFPDGSKETHTTEQYEIGTYLIINNDASRQGSVGVKEPAYHLSLRKKVLKAKDKGVKLTGGSILSYSGKEPVNTFE